MLAPLALLIDFWLGEPKALYRRAPHPIVLVGNFAAWVERRFNQGQGRLAKGFFGWVLVVGACAWIGWTLQSVLQALGWAGWLVTALLASAFVAYKSLGQHVRCVQNGLDMDLTQGRRAVSHIVGRDTRALDESGVARAGIESLAENFNDGVVAPLFWLLVAGLPGLLAYKAINTLDSMWGYRNSRFERFGKVAARMDDFANWIPARLSGWIIVAASQLSRQACGLEACRAMVRDAGKHSSPNAGWPEAAMAGGLGILLGGPRMYAGSRLDAPYIGRRQGKTGLSASNVGDALRLYRICGFVTLAVFVFGSLILGAVRGNFTF